MKETFLPSTLSGATATSLSLPANMTYDEWASVGETLRQIERAAMWWIGDWWAFGDHKYGERAAQMTDGEAYETWRGAGWVSSKFSQTVRRRTVLSWSHHKEVAALTEAQADRLLDKAEAEGWSRNKLRDAVQALRQQRPIEKPKAPPEVETYTPRDQEVDNLRDALATVSQQNEELRVAVATNNIPDGCDSDSLIAELRAENATLKATLAVVTRARDALMTENAQMKRQLEMQRKDIKRLRVVA